MMVVPDEVVYVSWGVDVATELLTYCREHEV